MERRIRKQIIIGLIFILLISWAGYGVIDRLFIVEPTCFDGAQNGLEEGLDCGIAACGVACEPEIMPLDVLSHELIEVRPSDYDFVARINNPNLLFGASRVAYTLNIMSSGGARMQERGTFYVLPGQTRFVIFPGIRTDNGATGASIEITEVEWQRVQGVPEDINFPVQKINYAVVDRDGIFSEFGAVVSNNSDFDFDKVEVGVVLFGIDNEIIAVNRTDIRTFLSRTERHFRVSWPTELPETVRQDVEVLTNVFENANFIRRHGTQERFQFYY